MLSQASRSSVTLWEETAPVKLTRRHCPSPGLQHEVRILINKEWCFTLRLQRNRSHALQSLPPTLSIINQNTIPAYSKGA